MVPGEDHFNKSWAICPFRQDVALVPAVQGGSHSGCSQYKYEAVCPAGHAHWHTFGGVTLACRLEAARKKSSVWAPWRCGAGGIFSILHFHDIAQLNFTVPPVWLPSSRWVGFWDSITVVGQSQNIGPYLISSLPVLGELSLHLPWMSLCSTAVSVWAHGSRVLHGLSHFSPGVENRARWELNILTAELMWVNAPLHELWPRLLSLLPLWLLLSWRRQCNTLALLFWIMDVFSSNKKLDR